jgi:hypothetical protein
MMPRAALWSLVAVIGCGPSPSAPPPAPVIGVPPASGPAVTQGAFVVTLSRDAVVTGPPEAPVEKGSCEVVARLFDADSDSPVNAAVSLWRVGVPEDARWTGGDQCYGGPATTLEASIRFEDIPPGRYRIACADQRAGAEDAPEFVVTRGERRVDVPLLLARTFRARIRIVDAEGRPAPSVARARSLTEGLQGKGCAWVRPRIPKFAREPEPIRLGRPGCIAEWGRPAPETVATDSGYLGLRNYTETSRIGQGRWTEELTPPGCATIRAVVSSDDAADETFAGLAVTLDALVAHVTRPDGARVTTKDAVVSATGDAVRCAWAAPPDAERASAFRVSVTAPGFEPLEFTWTFAERDTPHVLVPARPK